ncbi:hypothetical protein ACIHFC_10185 [Streptomyces sp. NPDC052013]|uniref:hypothetical protein n=1 Tax=Streptomyces sp. NPDC052013 TaxID=3365679 RepID=UPI0037D98072
MILHHLVLDTPTLPALSGNRQESALIHRAHFEAETRLWVPAPSALEADRPKAYEGRGVPVLDLER